MASTRDSVKSDSTSSSMEFDPRRYHQAIEQSRADRARAAQAQKKNTETRTSRIFAWVLLISFVTVVFTISCSIKLNIFSNIHDNNPPVIDTSDPTEQHQHQTEPEGSGWYCCNGDQPANRQHGTPNAAAVTASNDFITLMDLVQPLDDLLQSKLLEDFLCIATHGVLSQSPNLQEDIEPLEYTRNILQNTRDTVATAAHLGEVAANEISSIILVLEGTAISANGAATSVAQLEKRFSMVMERMESVSKTLKGNALCPDLRKRASTLGDVESLIRVYIEALDRLIATKPTTWYGKASAWITCSSKTFAAAADELTTFEKLQQDVKESQRVLNICADNFEAYLVMLNEQLIDKLSNERMGLSHKRWTRLAALRALARSARDRGKVGGIVADNYAVLLEEVEGMQLTLK
ncbi:hypothetical protein IWZ03DRAFT_391130 [Phyllosticta citriasiana]|uniref:Uncharacterized protein n=1 Tax=Phyllosticta citriasiana TaxID=595635 RepID=A0ABR1K9R9_9PEZI